MKKNIILFFTILVALMGGILSCAKKEENKITIASKNFTENIILAEMLGIFIDEKTDIEVEVLSNLGSTFVVHSAMQAGEIDMYPDYTGTLYQTVLKESGIVSAEKSLEIVQEKMLENHNQVVFSPFGFNNTYAIGLLKAKAEELGLKTISDIKNHPSLIAGFDSEFIDRADGGIKMLKKYGIELDNDIVSLEIGLKYYALNEGDVDFIDAFSTDGKIKRFEMTILEDDKQFFPFYYAVSVVRKETLDKFPQLQNILQLLENQINETEMTDMNFEVEENTKDPEDVAKQFLIDKGLL